MTEIRIYFEGNKNLRPGFRKFLSEIYEAAASRHCRVQLISAGGTPIEDFKDALREHPQAWNVLLKDSEVADNGRLFADLCRTHQFHRSTSNSAFWMVQAMESWFLADREKLVEYYGKGFRESVLPGNPNVEAIPKNDLHRKLKTATRSTQKGEYHKTRHAPHLLERVRAEKVKQRAPHCRRLFDILLRELSHANSE